MQHKQFSFLFVGDRYVIETDGLLIKNVDYNDAGTYTCRARVMETGSLEERDIKLEVNIFTVFENHRKSRIKHCEQSKLRLHFEWPKVHKKCQKWSILDSF